LLRSTTACRNILRCLPAGLQVTAVPATTPARRSWGAGPTAFLQWTCIGGNRQNAVPIRNWSTAACRNGICLGHQMLGLALGAKTMKMHQGHHGANHPVKDFTTGKVEITSMNHGFAVDRDSLPAGVEETHVSLFDGSNAGLRLEGKPVFSVQYHPEASPGPQDSHYLFTRFTNLMREQKGKKAVAERRS
jgi:carbamoyl-phosphate synthase small subunit